MEQGKQIVILSFYYRGKISTLFYLSKSVNIPVPRLSKGTTGIHLPWHVRHQCGRLALDWWWCLVGPYSWHAVSGWVARLSQLMQSSFTTSVSYKVCLFVCLFLNAKLIHRLSLLKSVCLSLSLFINAKLIHVSYSVCLSVSDRNTKQQQQQQQQLLV